MKALVALAAVFALPPLAGRAQCVTSLVPAVSCTVPGGASVITDAGGANTNVVIVGGTFRYTGTAGISNLNMAGGTLYYASNGTLNGANISGGTIIFLGSGAASGITQSGGTMQVCGGGQLALTGNLNAGSFVVAAGGQLTFPNTFTLQNSARLTNYGTVTFQSNLTIASGTTGAFVNAGTVTANNQVFLNGPGFVNQGTATFGTLAVNGSGRACLSPRSVLNVGTYQTNDNANSLTVSPTNGNQACVRVSGYGNFNAAVATDAPSKLVICRAGTASAAELGKYGTAQVTQNCANCGNVLPVVLTEFKAQPQGGSVALTWATASEKNSARFEVERSPDGESFAQVGAVAAAGSSSAARPYSYRDAAAPAGVLYYRLRQVDLDGTFSYSPVRTVALAGLSLYPNPTPGRATLLTGALPGTVVTVLDALGRLVTLTTADAAGTAALALPVGLPVGLYVVRAGTKSLRLTVEWK